MWGQDVRRAGLPPSALEGHADGSCDVPIGPLERYALAVLGRELYHAWASRGFHSLT